VVLRGVNEEDVVDIVRFANERGIVPRFIEYMPFNSVGETRWYASNEETRGQIEEAFGPLVPASVPGGGPAEYLQNRSGSVVVGFISPISCPFCQSCSRLRLGADGKLKPCLVSDRSYDAKLLLESDESEQQMKELMQQVIEYKKVRCGFSPEFENSQTVMFRVGG